MIFVNGRKTDFDREKSGKYTNASAKHYGITRMGIFVGLSCGLDQNA